MKKPINLAPLEDAFQRATLPTFETPLPDGIYEVEVETVELCSTRHSQKPMLCWTLRLLSPPSEATARRLWRNQVLNHANLGWLKKDLLLCGLVLEKLSDLPHHLHQLRGFRLEIVKRTQGEYPSIRFRRALAPASE